MRSRHLGALLAGLLVAWPAMAQEQSASIAGSIKDSSGAAIPRATVEARSASGLAVSAASDETGRYRFPSLPPGTYEVTAKIAGFSPALARDIEIFLGQILKVDLILTAARVEESVTVTADRPLIDVTQSARSTHIRDEQIAKLPRRRDFTSLVTQATGANPEGAPDFASAGISIDGASGSENRFIVDGVETTDLMDGGSGMGLITDFVEEVQVKSSGYAAEYGGATGGVVNVMTRSGTNRWAGEVGAYYSGEWLQGEPRPFLQLKPTAPTEAEYVMFPKDAFDQWEPGFSLSGPIKKDVAWLFASYQPSLSFTDRTVTFRANNQTGTFSSNIETHNASANVTAQIKNKTRARVAFNMSPSIGEGTLPFQHGGGNPSANYGSATRHSNYAVSSSVDYIATPNLFFTARGAYRFANTRNEGIHQGPLYNFARSNVGMEGVPADLQGPQGTSTGSSNREITRNIFRRTSLQLDGTWFVSAGGQHAVKAGVQLDRPGNDVVSGETGNVVSLFWGDSFGGQRGRFGYYRVRSNGVIPERGILTEGDVHSNNLGFFIQDAWTIADRLTLNLGLRAESERIPSYTAAYGADPNAIDFGFGEKLAPRVGAAWDVKGDGKWKVYGSWGIFYDNMKYMLARDRFGGVKFVMYWYALDTPDWPNLMRPGCPPACPGRLIEGPVDLNRPANTPDGNAIDPDLEPFRLQEAAAGLEHELTRSISVAVRYVHKQVDVAVEDIGALDAEGNQVYIIGNPGFHRASQTGFGPAFPKAVRDYDGLELTLNKRMADRWALRASYLWSRLYGNYSGLSSSAEGTPIPNHGTVFDHPILAFGENGQPVLGVLPADRTHQFKTHAIYDFPFGTSVGTSIRAMSGAPVAREARFVRGHGYSVPYRGRNSEGRLPALSQVDLYAQHEIKLRGDKRLQLSINVMNLFDQDTPLLRYGWELIDVVDIDEAEFFRGFDIGQLITSQRLRRDPFFLMDYGFQLPREIRLGVKLIF